MAATELLTSDSIRQGSTQQAAKPTKAESAKVREVKQALDAMGVSLLESDILPVYRDIGHSANVESIVAEVMART